MVGLRNWRLVPIIRSEELLEEFPEIEKNEIFVAPSKVQDVQDIPFEITPRPLKPITAVAEEVVDFVGPLLEPASPLAKGLRRQEHPFDESQVLCQVYDRYGLYRAAIYEDGTVRNNRDELMGYINAEEAQAGSATEDYLGELEHGALSHVLYARGPFAELVALCDLGRTRITGHGDSTVVEFTPGGHLIANDGSRLGQFSPFSFDKFKLLSLYLLFLDPGMMSIREVQKQEDDDHGDFNGEVQENLCTILDDNEIKEEDFVCTNKPLPDTSPVSVASFF